MNAKEVFKNCQEIIKTAYNLREKYFSSEPVKNESLTERISKDKTPDAEWCLRNTAEILEQLDFSRRLSMLFWEGDEDIKSDIHSLYTNAGDCSYLSYIEDKEDLINDFHSAIAVIIGEKVVRDNTMAHGKEFIDYSYEWFAPIVKECIENKKITAEDIKTFFSTNEASENIKNVLASQFTESFGE